MWLRHDLEIEVMAHRISAPTTRALPAFGSAGAATSSVQTILFTVVAIAAAQGISYE